jgi:hypothetical protein
MLGHETGQHIFFVGPTNVGAGGRAERALEFDQKAVTHPFVGRLAGKKRMGQVFPLHFNSIINNTNKNQTGFPP